MNVCVRLLRDHHWRVSPVTHWTHSSAQVTALQQNSCSTQQQHTVHSTQHRHTATAHSAQRTAHSNGTQCTAHSAQHTATATAHSAQHTAHSAQRTAHSNGTQQQHTVHSTKHGTRVGLCSLCYRNPRTPSSAWDTATAHQAKRVHAVGNGRFHTYS